MSLGPNTSGLSNSDYYAIGKGCLLFAELDANGAPKDYRQLGNAPDFSTTINQEDLEHRDAKSGTSEIDRTITLSRDIGISFTLEEINDENVAMLLGGDQVVLTNPATAGIAAIDQILLADVVLGRTYELRDGSGVRLYDIDSADLTLTDGTTPLVLGTDYTVNEIAGTFHLIEGSGYTAVASIEATVVANAGADDIDQVTALTKASIVGALKFLREDPETGDIQEWQYHKVKLSPNGDAALITDNALISLPFTGTAQKNTAYSPASPTLTVSTPQGQ